MQSRTRTLLTGAALTLLAVACAAGIGASTAAAASQHAAVVHKISACGYVATAPGTYELTKSITDVGSGNCITLNGNNITLYLNAHTITGTGNDTCVFVEGAGTAESVNETIIGGTKAKPETSATLTNCGTGMVVYHTSGTKASNLKIVAPTSIGVVEEIAGGMTLSSISVPLPPASTTADGFELVAGADNVVTKSTVDSNSSGSGFLAVTEIGDSFTYDTVKNTYNGAGSAGTGFVDAGSSRDTWSHDTSSGQLSGFVLVENGSGPVTATYDTATGPSTNAGSYGFKVIAAYQATDSASRFHTLISHNKSTGFQYGFFDHTDTSGPVAEKWTNNTADNYSEYGFYIDYPTDYTMTGNVADANTAEMTYAGGSTCGFCLTHALATFPVATFANNQAYDSEYGFNSAGAFVGGKGNIAKRNKYNANNVEITG